MVKKGVSKARAMDFCHLSVLLGGGAFGHVEMKLRGIQEAVLRV